MSVEVQVINQRFGRWTALEKISGYPKNNRYLCRCDCGSEHIILGFTLRSGNSAQCNKCRLSKGHGKTKTPTHNIWLGLFTRCYNKNSATYKYYGAKGITISDEWRSFENFYNDMGERPLNYQLDRIDSTKGYFKDNCRWISKADNIKRQKSRLIDITDVKFGKWTVIDRDHTNINKDHAYWNAICECGYKASVLGGMLRTGSTKQCRDCKNKAHGKIHSGWNKRKMQKEAINK